MHGMTTYVNMLHDTWQYLAMGIYVAIYNCISAGYIIWKIPMEMLHNFRTPEACSGSTIC